MSGDGRAVGPGGRPLVVAHVNAAAGGGGAEAVARQLVEGLLRDGHRASLLVGRGPAAGPDVHVFPQATSARIAHLVAGPLRRLERLRGLETYRYPGTRTMLQALPEPPDIVHLHNLHGGYFDLRALAGLSRRNAVVLTLHDAWLLSGHCAHSLGCERWRTGCGACPDLTIYPAVRRDATAANWRRKRDIFRNARLHVAAPSRWLAERVQASMLEPAVTELRVIPNGVDLETFRPGSRDAARAELGLPPGAAVLLFVGAAARTNPFKDYETAERAVAAAAERLDRAVTLVVLGDRGPDVRAGRAGVRFVPFEPEPARVARYYHAADLYLHAAHADTFPTSVLEALACGTPVVATAVGGIPEQLRGLAMAGSSGADPAAATGILVPPADADAMAQAIGELLEDAPLCAALGRNAAADARERFDARRQLAAYLDWYRAILAEPRS